MDLFKAKQMLKMRISRLLSIMTMVMIVCACLHGSTGNMFIGQDLHMRSETMTVYTDAVDKIGKNMILFEGGFTMNVGANTYSSDSAIVRIKTVAAEILSSRNTNYKVDVYLEGNVDISKRAGSRTSGVDHKIVHQGYSLVTSFLVTGDIFATADVHQKELYENLENMEIFEHGVTALVPVPEGPAIAYEARLPQYYIGSVGGMDLIEPIDAVADSGYLEGSMQTPEEAFENTKPEYRYPINIAALWDPAPVIESTKTDDGQSVATMIGRFYLWQKQNERGGLLEFQADSAVIFYSGDNLSVDKDEDVMASGPAESIYLRGNIIMTEGERTIRAEEIYYDFNTHKGIALQSEFRTFDEERSIPVYVRADKLRMMSDTLFSGENMTVTTSEFHLPQISLTASKMVLADLNAVDSFGREYDRKFEALLKDIKMKYGDKTIFKWGKIRTDFQRPDVPIKSIRIGDNSRLGTMVQTQWYFAKMLGMREPEGVDSTFLLDYASDRGPATGALIDYERDDYYGGMSAYVINDKGEDDLGRASWRRDLEPDQNLRGRFTARHRHFLADDWQATYELSYLSDRNFLESYFRREHNDAKDQETLFHLKRIQDNSAVSILAKMRINDFANETEEMPTISYHLKGQSFWDHRLTFYNDTSIGIRRDLMGDDSAYTAGEFDESFYTYAMSRNEVDMPMLFRSVKIVPYIAGTYALDDTRGFTTTLGEDRIEREQQNMLGELGVRFATMFWKDSQVESKFWDLSGMRHTILPHVEIAMFEGTDDSILMRNMYNFGLSQKWQTHRGTEDNRRTIDWMRLDVDATFMSDVADSAESLSGAYGPARYIWNNQNIPLLTRRGTSMYGIVRDSIGVDYEWQISDTASLMSDLVWDMEGGSIQQANVGITRYIYPDISYYLGHRYLKPVVITSDGKTEVGSSSLIAAMSYALNERYTATFSVEHNFEYGGIVTSELSLIRRYHRLYYGMTFALDETLDTSSLMFTVWPEGVKDLTFGDNKLSELSDRVMTE